MTYTITASGTYFLDDHDTTLILCSPTSLSIRLFGPSTARAIIVGDEGDKALIHTYGEVTVENHAPGARITLHENTRAVIHDGHVQAYDDTHVVALSRGEVSATDDSQVIAHGTTSLELSGGTRVSAFDMVQAHVGATDYSAVTVALNGSAALRSESPATSAVLRGRSTFRGVGQYVHAYDRSHVVIEGVVPESADFSVHDRAGGEVVQPEARQEAQQSPEQVQPGEPQQLQADTTQPETPQEDVAPAPIETAPGEDGEPAQDDAGQKFQPQVQAVRIIEDVNNQQYTAGEGGRHAAPERHDAGEGVATDTHVVPAHQDGGETAAAEQQDEEAEDSENQLSSTEFENMLSASIADSADTTGQADAAPRAEATPVVENATPAPEENTTSSPTPSELPSDTTSSEGSDPFANWGDFSITVTEPSRFEAAPAVEPLSEDSPGTAGDDGAEGDEDDDIF